MSNGKSGRKKLVKTVLGIIILVIASLFGVEVFPTAEGTLYLHMIDQTTPNMIQGLKGIFARKPLISIGI